MPYVLTKTDDFVIVEHAIDGFYLTTRSSATSVVKQGSSISVNGIGATLNMPYSDIGTIGGATPTSPENAVDLLSELFKGYPKFTLTGY